jgi:hypothetical protein
MGERQKVVLDPAVLAIVGRQEAGGRRQEGKGRRTKRRPHEVGRAGRKLTVTLPGAAWRDAIAEEAERCGLRPCDLVTFAFAHYMAAVEGGELARPRGDAQYWQRAGEGLTLPWEP